MKLNEPRIISTRDSPFFTNRTINLWNSLPDSTVNAPTVIVLNVDQTSFIIGPLFLILPVSRFNFTVSSNDFLGAR